jgi:putative sigma-54 modulation protein
MPVVLTGRHIEITPALRKLVDGKVTKLDRLFGTALVSMQVVLQQEKNRRVAELVVHLRGDHVLHGEGTAPAWPGAVTAAVSKVAQQGQKIKGKWQERKRRATPAKAVAARRVAAAEPLATPGPRIVRAARYGGKPMTVEDAAREASASREGVIVFRNASTDAVTVLYRRRNGDLGLIEPEA